MIVVVEASCVCEGGVGRDVRLASRTALVYKGGRKFACSNVEAFGEFNDLDAR